MNQQIGYVLAIAVFYAVGSVHPALAEDAPFTMEYSQERPLMVIRFNQTHVIYERSLYNTVSEALKVKPSATFEIVSVSPKAQSKTNQQHNDQLTSQNTHKVVGTLSEMGLPQSRYSVKDITDNVNASEVRIFVH